jgi:endonuclease YncB( thermonuclease family)
MKNFKMRFIVIILLVFGFPYFAQGHGGGLDGLGCHHNRKAGGYHCHRGPLAGQQFQSKRDAQQNFQGPLNRQSTPQSQSPLEITGNVRVIDGDTIQVGNDRIRLHGIDAPEAKQMCTLYGKKWLAGQAATTWLRTFLGTKLVSCTGEGVDRYGRIIATCYADGQNVNDALVSAGWALAYLQYSKRYASVEKRARLAKRGIWLGRCVEPWAWRRSSR